MFVCDGRRLQFELTSTIGNERRELFFDLIQRDLREVGIALDEAFGEPGEVFSRDVLAAGRWELFLFAWVGTPDPDSAVEMLGCFVRGEDGGAVRGADPRAVMAAEPDDPRYGHQNHHRYCPGEALSDQLLATRSQPDPDQRHEAMNEAVGAIARAIPTLPLYQLPSLLAYDADLAGPAINTTQWGPVWNVQEWGWTGTAPP